MKYLKLFETYESNKTFFGNVKDIMMPINDDGFYVEIHNNNGEDELMESEGEYVRIYIEKQDTSLEGNDNVEREYLTKPYTPTETFIDTIEHLLSYTLDNKYSLSIELISESQAVAYEEYPSETSIKSVLDITKESPIDYIRIIIYN